MRNSSNKYKILLIEDEESIRTLVTALLEANGYQVVTAATCVSGQMMFASHQPDLTILDLGLPDIDGGTFLSNVRKNSSSPIIVLSARTDERDKVSALDRGANDYITKPFGSAELLARIRSTLRNNRRLIEHGQSMNGSFTTGDFTIDYDKRRVSTYGNEIQLTQTEYNIVALLSQYCGKVLTYSAIIKAIWGQTDEGSVKKLQVNMANIRKKLGAKPGANNIIINELGVGYRMDEKDDELQEG